MCSLNLLKYKSRNPNDENITTTVMSAYRVPLKTRFGNVQNVIKKSEFISKMRYQNGFCYIQQSEFRSVKQSRMYRDSIQDYNIDIST